MDCVSAEPVTCARCAHLWNRESSKPSHGRCACNARQQETGIVRELVDLEGTCEHAQLSAKCDPDFLPRLRAARRGDWETPETELSPPCTDATESP